MTKQIKIGNKKIGEGCPCFIIAEVSGNHNQSFARAEEIVRTACECGADAIKLQTYTPDTMTIDCSNKYFQIKGSNPVWQGKTLYKLYETAYTPWEWQPKLKKIADNYGVPLFSSPFDQTAVDFLEKMDVPAYKIASFEVVDTELLKKVAATKKPVIISRGMASLAELDNALAILRKNGASGIIVLHCVSSYPAKPEEMNLATIPNIKETFDTVAGLSDHTLTTSIAVAAVALGASVIEKHFTLRRSDGGPDAAFSLEPKELKELIKSVREVEKAVGRVKYGSGEKESENIIFRRSLFAVEDIKAGEKLSRKNVRCIRPGHGLSPAFFTEVLNRTARKDIKRGTPLSWDVLG